MQQTPRTPLQLTEHEAAAVLVAANILGQDRYTRDKANRWLKNRGIKNDRQPLDLWSLKLLRYFNDHPFRSAGIAAVPVFLYGMATQFNGKVICGLVAAPEMSGTASLLEFVHRRNPNSMRDWLMAVPRDVRTRFFEVLQRDQLAREANGTLLPNEARCYQNLFAAINEVEQDPRTNQVILNSNLIFLSTDPQEITNLFGDLDIATEETRYDAYVYALASAADQASTQYPHLHKKLGLIRDPERPGELVFELADLYALAPENREDSKLRSPLAHIFTDVADDIDLGPEIGLHWAL